MDLRIVEAETPEHWVTARHLIEAYATALGVDLGFQGFDAEMRDLSRIYAAPDGCLLIAERKGTAVGCIALRRFADDACEMKRLYVAPDCRGGQVGRRLVVAVVQRARDLHYRRMLLDTLPTMTAAQALYLSLGFVPIPAYRHNPIEGTAYLQLEL